MSATLARRPSLAEMTLYFLQLGATGFGGPVALANAIRTDLAERRRWISEDEYDRGLTIAAACPGPMAYQLGVYCGYVTHGAAGGIAVGLAFASAPFVFVTALAALYVHYAASDITRGLFYGVGPVVVALILKGWWSLGLKTLKRDTPAWIVAGVALAVTVLVQRELTVLFVGAGVLGIFAFAPKPATVEPSAAAVPVPPAAARLRSHAAPLLLAALPGLGAVPSWDLFAFFFRTGLMVFGSGLVIVSFVKAYVVDQYHWMNERTFLDAVAIGMISPGPVVITATFVGFIVGGFSGALASTVGIFLPSIIITVLGTPILLRYRKNRFVMGLVRGVTVAVVGVLAGTAYLVGKPVIGDWVTALILITVLALPRLPAKIPDQVLVAAGAIVGLVAYPLLRPGWMLQ
jgi:chromate transporter